MPLSKLVYNTLIAAACVGTLSLNSCDSGSSSSSSSTESSLDLITPYEMTIQWNGSDKELSMRPSTATNGSVDIEVLSLRDDIQTLQGIYEWTTLPNAETNEAELQIIHRFLSKSNTSISGIDTYTIHLTFTDKTTATATVTVDQHSSDAVDSTLGPVNNLPASFTRPLF